MGKKEKAVGEDHFQKIAVVHDEDLEVAEIPNKGVIISFGGKIEYIEDATIRMFDISNLVHPVCSGPDTADVSVIKIGQLGSLLIIADEIKFIPGVLTYPISDGHNWIH